MITLRPKVKISTDLKTGLEKRRIRFTSGAKLTVFGQLGFDTRQMLKLGQYGVFLIRDRASKGIGADDAPMKPLSERKGQRWSISQQKYVTYGRNTGYKFRKVAAGGKPIRDLTLTGAMLGNISVRSVSATQARIDITSAKERMKARANEQRNAWWGWSPQDVAKLSLAARELFGENLSIGAGAAARGKSSFGSSAIWMRPWLHNYGAAVEAKETRGLTSGPLRRTA